MTPQDKLLRSVKATAHSIDSAGAMLRMFNEPEWPEAIGRILAAARGLLDVHGVETDAGVADDYANLFGVLSQIAWPDDIQDAERDDRLATLRQCIGGLALDTYDVVQKARDIGIAPSKSGLEIPNGTLVSKSGREMMLRVLLDRLTAIEVNLNAVRAPSTISAPHYIIMVNHYQQVMKTNIASIKLAIITGPKIDLAILERAGAAMASITGKFIKTLRSAASLASDLLINGVKAIASPVSRLIRGVGTLVKRVIYEERAQPDIPPAPNPPPTLEPGRPLPLPSDFHYQAEEMILVGNNVPEDWIPHIKTLDFSKTNFSNLASLVRFSALENLNISSTKISDLMPIANIVTLKKLKISHADIIDLNPISQLENLIDLTIQSRQHFDLKFINNLSSLKSLTIISSKRLDLTPLSKLKNLEDISFIGTTIVDILPLANLSHLERLYFYRSNVSDLTPLSDLTTLRKLVLDETQVRSLAPLSNLQKLTIQVDRMSFRTLRSTIRSGAVVKVVRE